MGRTHSQLCWQRASYSAFHRIPEPGLLISTTVVLVKPKRRGSQTKHGPMTKGATINSWSVWEGIHLFWTSFCCWDSVIQVGGGWRGKKEQKVSNRGGCPKARPSFISANKIVLGSRPGHLSKKVAANNCHRPSSRAAMEAGWRAVSSCKGHPSFYFGGGICFKYRIN